MHHYVFKQMEKQDIPVYLTEMFDILADNMNRIAPTGKSYQEDYKIWSECVVPVFSEGKRSVILILDDGVLCGYFQYCVTDTTFRMDEIQFRPEYHGSGLFSELYHCLTNIIPAQIKYVDAYSHKANHKSQGILKHLGLEECGESKNGNTLYFKGEYKTIYERYS
ncbi:MAG: hypothetical protein MJ175_04090 [Clostridia bacterium]|nr:hypothetical protein [Clostridia bacterium]